MSGTSAKSQNSVFLTKTSTILASVLCLHLSHITSSIAYAGDRMELASHGNVGLRLKEAIRHEYDKIRQAGELNVNINGNDITSVVINFISMNDTFQSAEKTLKDAGFELATPRKKIIHEKEVSFVFATASEVLGPEGESLGSEVTIRLSCEANNGAMQVTGLLAYISTTEL